MPHYWVDENLPPLESVLQRHTSPHLAAANTPAPLGHPHHLQQKTPCHTIKVGPQHKTVSLQWLHPLRSHGHLTPGLGNSDLPENPNPLQPQTVTPSSYLKISVQNWSTHNRPWTVDVTVKQREELEMPHLRTHLPQSHHSLHIPTWVPQLHHSHNRCQVLKIRRCGRHKLGSPR